MLKNENLQPEKGITNLIRYCEKYKIKIALATSSVDEQVEAIIKAISGEIEFTKIFDVIVSGDDVQNKKPAPDIYNVVLKRLKIIPERCLAIEDSAAGIMSAKKAGINVVGITSPFADKISLSEADLLFESVDSFSKAFAENYENVDNNLW